MIQNLTTCLYQTELGLVTVTWCRTPMSSRFLNFTVHPHLAADDDDETATVSHRLRINRCLFWRKTGKKRLCLQGRKARLYWDLSKARFSARPEPDRGFYLCLVSDRKNMVLLVGDLRLQAYALTRADPPSVNPTLLSRLEHVVGRRIYAAKASFGGGDGKQRAITIEWDPDEHGLSFRVDGKPVLKVHRVAWKFRGNDRFVVDGIPVHVYWDVHKWLFESESGHAVFMFQPERIGGSSETGSSPVRWPSGFVLNRPEKTLLKTGSFSSQSSLSSSCRSSSVVEWANTDFIPNSGGFSLTVYAWRA